ncbi:hypothetical protein [Sphingomonas sp. Leaf4]|uniref:hypothetical protein n=1 Tax=Sphingomonas sp. Leaf4 TaxID=2876553 RepID=UPI001E2C8E58|nr:hypothetical protein [Sphingomonas sp. Leaf4]
MGFSTSLPWDAKMPMPQSYNPFMRGQWLEWQKAYGRFVDTDRVADAFYDTKVAPLLEVGNVPPELWAISNANYSKRTDALFALIRTPAPGPAELAIKLKLFHEAEGQECQNASELIGCLLIDARRFGRQGAYIQTDRALLAAIGQRVELEQTYPDGENDDEWARHARRIRENASLVIQPAATIEGVLAKMRLAFTTDAVMAWSQHALTDASHPDFRKGLSESGGCEPLFWSAIEDLARLAGIDLGGPIVVPDASKHTAWLNERNDLLAAADRSEADVSDDVALTRINDLDGRIITTPATSADDVIAKLVMAMEVQAEGANISSQEAAMLIREAKAHLGIGYVYSAEVAA